MDLGRMAPVSLILGILVLGPTVYNIVATRACILQLLLPYVPD